ncbi:MAG: N-acetylornithine carbamoyltransferase [Bacteroidota bacterium]
MKQFIAIEDIDNLTDLLAVGKKCKEAPYQYQHLGKNKTLGLLFFNPSLRTHLSTQKAAFNLGMQVMTMNIDKEGWQLELEEGATMNQQSQEHIKEAAQVLSQYCDCIGIRAFASLEDRTKDYEEHLLQKFIQYSSVPVISLESATKHPLQGFTDLLTIEEYKKHSRPKVVLTWAPHPKPLPQAVANSFVAWMQQAEVELVITHPKGFELAPSIVQQTPVVYDQEEAFQEADFIYAKNWSTYAPYGQVGVDLSHWMIDTAKMALTNQAHFMHCLPVRRNVVVEDAVLDAPTALHITQANNRTYAAQAVLLKILQDD